MSDSKQSTYRSIFKATSLFGGLQLYLIFISIIKSKFIAILLGPLGVGIQGLFQSGTEVIRTLTNFGLSQSAVREVSEANGNKDEVRIKLVTSVINKLVWITGLLGAILVCVPIYLISPLTILASVIKMLGTSTGCTLSY